MQTIETRANQALARIAMCRRGVQAVKTAAERTGRGGRTSMKRVGDLMSTVDREVDLIEVDVQYVLDAAPLYVRIEPAQRAALDEIVREGQHAAPMSVESLVGIALDAFIGGVRS